MPVSPGLRPRDQPLCAGVERKRQCAWRQYLESERQPTQLAREPVEVVCLCGKHYATIDARERAERFRQLQAQRGAVEANRELSVAALGMTGLNSAIAPADSA